MEGLAATSPCASWLSYLAAMAGQQQSEPTGVVSEGPVPFELGESEHLDVLMLVAPKKFEGILAVFKDFDFLAFGSKQRRASNVRAIRFDYERASDYVRIALGRWGEGSDPGRAVDTIGCPALKGSCFCCTGETADKQHREQGG
jgi:hypothetical protein